MIPVYLAMSHRLFGVKLKSAMTSTEIHSVAWTSTPKCLLALLLLCPSSGFAHGGGLNADGCHTNHKTNEKHCHRGDSSFSSKENSELISGSVNLLSVGDGDTIRVTNRQEEKATIRLACIDAPETSQASSGKWSTERLKALIRGKSISLKPQVKDRYGRTVAEVYVGSRNINLQMVQEGAAFAYRKYLKQCDQDAYLKAEKEAMKRNLGVWGPYKVDQKPWDYRRSRHS